MPCSSRSRSRICVRIQHYIETQYVQQTVERRDSRQSRRASSNFDWEKLWRHPSSNNSLVKRQPLKNLPSGRRGAPLANPCLRSPAPPPPFPSRDIGGSSPRSSVDDHVDGFLKCLKKEFHNYTSISSLVYTPINSSYQSVLDFSIRNKRFISDSTPKPLVIITPEYEYQIAPIIYCAKHNQLQIRTRSGGHDFEGLSYVTEVPFVIIDLLNFSEITVDAEQKTAWLGAGATIGMLYYNIAVKSPRLAFPAGFSPTVGVGGHFSGGGWGVLLRKYGLAADHVIDARIVDVNGRILDRNSMGEDLFWAIRGGGGASFGVILAWKVRLVDVPETVTVFTIYRDLNQNATQLIHRWQSVAPNFNEDLFLRIVIRRNISGDGRMTIRAAFNSVFLGGIDRLLAVMEEKFPELGLVRDDCIEMSWIQSILYNTGLPIDSLEPLLDRFQHDVGYYKGKSDYVQEPIPISGLEGIWKLFYEPEGSEAEFLVTPYGGRMAEIPDNAIPFPHRAGYLYKSPRGAYFNYRDLDIGVNNAEGPISIATARVWGEKYFNKNFKRLVQVKTRVDPKNFFRDEQSIPHADGGQGKRTYEIMWLCRLPIYVSFNLISLLLSMRIRHCDVFS
ncbi:Berberine bridge enzyme-like 18 [Sesamum angolense]|uniref:Berberine bridge enzyme-like 18 n=1 Tax=Sesamum angolense TaxID=2727404 RepID=A0AAE2BVM0_9LAMI|nr:Berberine bridge enzyme-like 18 [Sesamum angolense]